MNTNLTRRIITALSGSAIAAGLFAGGLGLGSPGQANADTGKTGTCVTAQIRGNAFAAPNTLTRAGQVAAGTAAGRSNSSATSCLGH